ncbi:uncharacterized protein [Eleutherodactylus coqui]|uniref:uncharacterized protein n=1 Tax=Eleutherodactylus coqui TaxID=57060 RepID=UPI003462AE5F
METPSVMYVGFNFTILNSQYNERLSRPEDPDYVSLKNKIEELALPVIRRNYPFCLLVITISFSEGSVKVQNAAAFPNSSVAPSSDQLQSAFLGTVREDGGMMGDLQLFAFNTTTAEPLTTTGTLTTTAAPITTGTLTTTAAPITTGTLTTTAAPITTGTLTTMETPSVMYVGFNFTILNSQYNERLSRPEDPDYVSLKNKIEELALPVIRRNYPFCLLVITISFSEGSVKVQNAAAFPNSSVAPSSDQLQSAFLGTVREDGGMMGDLQLFAFNTTTAEPLTTTGTLTTTAAPITTGTLTTTAAPITTGTLTTTAAPITTGTMTTTAAPYNERLSRPEDPDYVSLKNKIEELALPVIRRNYPFCLLVITISFSEGSVKVQNAAAFPNSSVAPSSDQLQSAFLGTVREDGGMMGDLQLFAFNTTTAAQTPMSVM